MRRTIRIAVICLLWAGCSTGEDESISIVTEYLNGVLLTGGNLTRKTFSQPDENQRRRDTDLYYNSVLTGTNGTSGASISAAFPNLTAFKTRYGLDATCVAGAADCPRAFYYNRGDLGIGREMHCRDKINDNTKQEIACYVINFSAGDLNRLTDGEFRFGLSSNIAFANMAAGNAFATVAMVYRNLAPAKDKVFFVVFNEAGALVNTAALDRHGFNFALNPTDPSRGTPGVNFNNHIPSNCVACHGGNGYDSGTHSETGALFLPFDLDQFDYEAVAGRTRSDQAVQFQHLNEIARKVAALSGARGGPSVKNQLDLWYANTPGSNPKTEVFENPFNSAAIPSGWNTGSAAQNVYFSVVRPSCRGCHMTQSSLDTPVGGLSFDTETEFKSAVNVNRTVNDLCTFQMPHSLQTLRQFWQSQQPQALENYLNAIGLTTAANSLHACGPRDVATLDPPHIMTSVDIL